MWRAPHHRGLGPEEEAPGYQDAWAHVCSALESQAGMTLLSVPPGGDKRLGKAKAWPLRQKALTKGHHLSLF